MYKNMIKINTNAEDFFLENCSLLCTVSHVPFLSDFPCSSKVINGQGLSDPKKGKPGTFFMIFFDELKFFLFAYFIIHVTIIGKQTFKVTEISIYNKKTIKILVIDFRILQNVRIFTIF